MPSKFFNVSFPLIGLKDRPYDYYVRPDSIGIKINELSNWIVVDKFIEGKSSISRYLEAKPEDFLVDVTCLTMTHLITKKIAWGIDSKARVFDFSTPQKFKARNVQILRTKEDLIWVDTVSYPFKIKKSLLDSSLILEQFATIVSIDDEWILYKFTPFKQDIKELTL